MLTANNNLIGKLNSQSPLKGKLNVPTVEIYPDLEDVTITPTTTEQHLKSSKYGYDNVTVKGIETEEKVAELDFSNTNTIEVTPSEGKHLDKVTINKDVNLVANNIRKDVKINNIEGTMEVGIQLDEIFSLYTSKNTATWIKTAFKKIPKEILKVSVMSSISELFYGYTYLEEIELDNFNTTQLENLTRTFYNCINLKELDFSSYETNNVTSLYSTFQNCSNLKRIDFNNWDTSKVTTILTAFDNCTKLETIDGILNFNSLTQYTNAFRYCYELKNIKIKNLNCYLSLSNSTKLTYESLIYLIENLKTKETKTNLVIGRTNIAKLTDEEIAIATNKGWTVS